MDESAEAMKEALRDLLSTVETVATEAGVVSGLVDSITASMNLMESRAQTVKEINQWMSRAQLCLITVACYTD